MWWLVAVAVLVLISLILSVFAIALPKFKMIQDLVDRLNLVARENLAGMMVIRAFNMQAFEERRFEAANLDLATEIVGLYMDIRGYGPVKDQAMDDVRTRVANKINTLATMEQHAA